MKSGSGVRLRTILLTEALERFAFVGMQSLLVLYLVNFLLQPDQIGAAWFLAPMGRVLGLEGQPLAAAIVGGFSALIYLTPIGGGIITDRWLGQRRALLLGGVMLALGHLLLAQKAAFLPGLALLIIGTGFYKGSIAAQLGGLHSADDPRRADAFQLFFIVVALASSAAPLIIGWLGERVGWSAGFAAAGVAMMGAVIIYWWGTSSQPNDRLRVVALTPNLNPNDRRRIATLLWLVPLTALIVQPNFQMTNAYLVWGDRSFTLVAFGTRLPASWLLTLDAVVGTAMLLGVTLFWRWWRQYRPEPDELTKVVIGSGFTLAGTLALVAAAASANSKGGGIGLGWPIVFHALNDIGMALVLPVLLALATRLAPQAWQTTVASLYFVALFVGGLLAGWMGTRFEMMPTTEFWLVHAGLSLVSTIGFMLLRLKIARQVSGDKSVS
jgi:POT family proton-dependent oligopeptide transporter